MTPIHPPRLAAWILAHVTGSENRMSVLEDYQEIYRDLMERESLGAARSWYWNQVIRSLPMFIINLIYGSASMLKNYLKLAYRNILRHKRYALLNILGLAVGLAACLLMAGYVIHELSFESMYSQKDRIFRINGRIPMGGRTLINAVVSAPMGPAAKESLPEIEESVRIMRRRNVPVRIGEQDFRQSRLFFAEQELLSMFSLPLVSGERSSALIAPFSVILDQTLAQKYFGDQDPRGKSIDLTLDKTYAFQVTGVLKNMPSNTVIRIPMIVSFATLLQTHRDAMTHWESWGSITTFVRLRPGAESGILDSKITELARSHLSEDEQEASYYLQPIGSIYLDNAEQGINNDLDNSGNLTRIYIFSAIALLILIVAAINFINLSTAKIAGRMKEVGIRKTCGAVRSHLIKQFLMESLLITSLAMGLGLLLFSFFKPRLDIFLGKNLNLGILSTPWIIPSVAALVLGVGLLAGSYPAFFLSRFPAAVIFRSGSAQGPSRSGLRRVLVGTQFFFAAVLIVCTLGVLQQVRYSETKDLGFNKDNLILLRNSSAGQLKNASSIKNQLLQRTGVLAASVLDSFPSSQNRNISTIRTQEKMDEEGTIAQSLEVDADFVPTMGLQIAAGRNFQSERTDDERNVLLNETAVRSFELADPLGKILYRGEKAYTVIGILKDWNTNSLHSPIYPTIIFQADDSAAGLIAKLPEENTRQVLAKIREVWAEMLPGQIFDYAYVADLHHRAYDKERRLVQLLISFCQLTVLVSCLGIFGLAAYSTEQRTKEIGIRKVLGSSVGEIVILLTKNYTRWVLVANVFAWPAAYYIISRWLRAFAFRTPIGLTPFVLAGALTLSIALLSVLFQTLKASMADPVRSLRYE